MLHIVLAGEHRAVQKDLLLLAVQMRHELIILIIDFVFECTGS